MIIVKSGKVRAERQPLYVRLILTVLLLVLVISTQSQAASVKAAEFLVSLHDREGNQTMIYQSNLVPLIPNRVCYGWRIRLASDKGLIKFKEIFSLPTEPEFWGGENDEFSPNAIAKDRKTSVTERFAYVKDGWISHSWCVAKGDPEGKYTMEVYIEGEFAKRFDFEVRSVSSAIK